MVGLGEISNKVFELMKDLKIRLDILTMGQPLKPSKHMDVVEYVHPDIFKSISKSISDWI